METFPSDATKALLVINCLPGEIYLSLRQWTEIPIRDFSSYIVRKGRELSSRNFIMLRWISIGRRARNSVQLIYNMITEWMGFLINWNPARIPCRRINLRFEDEMFVNFKALRNWTFKWRWFRCGRVALVLTALSLVLTTQQHVITMAKPQMAPAVPTTHVKRMNNITPKMFWIHGKKHPMSVPVCRAKRKQTMSKREGKAIWILNYFPSIEFGPRSAEK